MDSSNVSSGFKTLIGEIDFVLEELNQQGARKFYTSDYAKAKKLLKNVEDVTSLKRQIVLLSEAWKKLNLDVASQSNTKEKPTLKTKKSKTKLAKGLITKAGSFEIPILLALDSLGGIGDIKEVMKIVEDLMTKDLTEYDWQSLPSDQNVIRWKNNVCWARLYLVKKGFLSNKSPKGIWEITESGLKELKESQVMKSK